MAEYAKGSEVDKDRDAAIGSPADPNRRGYGRQNARVRDRATDAGAGRRAPVRDTARDHLRASSCRAPPAKPMRKLFPARPAAGFQMRRGARAKLFCWILKAANPEFYWVGQA